MDLRGEGGGWFFRNVIESTNVGIRCGSRADHIWTWDNLFIGVATPTETDLDRDIHFAQRPPDFAEIPYPHELNRPGWWPSAP